MKYLFIIALVAVSLRLSAQTETTQARQNTNGQVNAAPSGKGAKIQGKTKAGEEGKITTRSTTGTTRDQTSSSSTIGSQTTRTNSSQKGKTLNSTKGTNGKATGQSKNANNKNGSKTNSSTTTSGSGKKDM